MKAPKGFKFQKLADGSLNQNIVYIIGLDLPFYMDGKHIPALPLKKNMYGTLWHIGWDIPTNYVIDSDNKCWADDAHGHALQHVKSHTLLSLAKNQADKNKIRSLLGMRPAMPEWAKTALKHEWTPSASFDKTKYE